MKNKAVECFLQWVHVPSECQLTGKAVDHQGIKGKSLEIAKIPKTISGYRLINSTYVNTTFPQFSFLKTS